MDFKHGLNTFVTFFIWLPLIIMMNCCLSSSAPIMEQSGDEELALLLEKMRKKAGQPALACAVIIDGEMKAAAAVGTRKTGTENWVSVEDRFIIGSCGKAFTSVLAAIMVEEGYLRWDTAIKDVFPDVAARAEYGDLIFQQLLSHRAGLVKSFLADLDPGKSYTWTAGRMEYLKQLSLNELIHSPGTALFYSNAGFILAGLMMEQLTGKEFMTLMADKVFKPLKLNTAGYGPPAKSNRLSQPWGHVRDKLSRSLKATLKEDQLYTTPAGNVCLSLTDWAKFIMQLMPSGPANNKPFLSSDILNRLHMPPDNSAWKYDQDYFDFWDQENGWPLDKSNYSMGWFVTQSKDGGIVLSHGGTSRSFQAEVYLSPAKKNAILLATNARLNHFHLYNTAVKINKKYKLNIDLP